MESTSQEENTDAVPSQANGNTSKFYRLHVAPVEIVGRSTIFTVASQDHNGMPSAGFFYARSPDERLASVAEEALGDMIRNGIPVDLVPDIAVWVDLLQNPCKDQMWLSVTDSFEVIVNDRTNWRKTASTGAV